MADSPYAKSPIPCPIYPIINNEFNGNTYINSDTSKGGKVYINGEEVGAGGIQELADGETLENRGGAYSMPVEFTGTNERTETIYLNGGENSHQPMMLAVFPTFEDKLRIKSLEFHIWNDDESAQDVYLEYGLVIKAQEGYERKAINTFQLPNSKSVGWPTVSVDAEIGGTENDLWGIYVSLPSDGVGTPESVTLGCLYGTDYSNEFPASTILYNQSASTWSIEDWEDTEGNKYSMSMIATVGNTAINRVTGSDIGNGEPTVVKSETEQDNSGKLYFDKENRKVYAGFDSDWEDISKYNADTLYGETDCDRGITMGELTTHTITETEASPDSISLKANPATGELGYMAFATPNHVRHNVRSFTPQITVSGSSSVTFEYGVAYQYGGYWEFNSYGDCILPPESAASPTYPTLTFNDGVTLDDNTCVYIKPLIDSDIYVHVSTDSTETSEHMYLTVAKTDEGWHHTIVNKAVAGTYTHIDSVAYTENRLTGVDIGYVAPTNYEQNEITGKLYIDTTNNAFYVGIGTHWYPITLGTPI